MKKVLTSVLILAILVGGVWFGIEYSQTQKELEEVKGELVTVTQSSLSFQKSLDKTKAEKLELESAVKELKAEKNQLTYEKNLLIKSNTTLNDKYKAVLDENHSLKRTVTNLKK